MNALLAVAVALLPADARDRYREEWTADLRDAAEAEVSRGSIVAGALVLAVFFRRSGTGEVVAPGLVARRRMRRGLAYTLSGLVAAFGLYVTGLGGGTSANSLVAVLQVITLSLQSAIAVAGIVGGAVFLGAGALASGSRSVGAAIGAATVLVGYLSIALAVWFEGFAYAAPVLLVGSGLVGIGIWLGVTASPMPARTHAAAPRRAPAVPGFLIVLVTIGVGAVDCLVWAPLTIEPGYSLANIYAAIGADAPFAIAEVAVWAAFWTGVAVLGLVLSRRGSPGLVVTLTLAVVSAVIFFQWGAGFGIGNAVSDALPPFAGGNSAFWPFYACAGQFALSGVILRTVAPRGALAGVRHAQHVE